MQFETVKAGLVGITAAIVSTLCCLLPLTVVILGLESGAFMMTTMQNRALFLPVGVFGVSLGYYYHFKKRRRCASDGCTFVRGRLNLILLSVAAVIFALALGLDFFPQLSSEILQIVM